MAFGNFERSCLQERCLPVLYPMKVRYINKQTIFRQMFLFSENFSFPKALPGLARCARKAQLCGAGQGRAEILNLSY
jgi:hypothetical protein